MGRRDVEYPLKCKIQAQIYGEGTYAWMLMPFTDIGVSVGAVLQLFGSRVFTLSLVPVSTRNSPMVAESSTSRRPQLVTSLVPCAASMNQEPSFLVSCLELCNLCPIFLLSFQSGYGAHSNPQVMAGKIAWEKRHCDCRDAVCTDAAADLF